MPRYTKRYNVMLWDAMRCPEMSRDATRCLEMPWDVARCHEMSKDVTRCHKKPRDAVGCNEMPLDAERLRAMPRDDAGCHKMPRDATRCREIPFRLGQAVDYTPPRLTYEQRHRRCYIYWLSLQKSCSSELVAEQAAWIQRWSSRIRSGQGKLCRRHQESFFLCALPLI